MLSTKGSPTKFYKVYDLEEGDLYKPGKENDTLAKFPVVSPKTCPLLVGEHDDGQRREMVFRVPPYRLL
jgi:hypothetical protein